MGMDKVGGIPNKPVTGLEAQIVPRNQQAPKNVPTPHDIAPTKDLPELDKKPYEGEMSQLRPTKHPYKGHNLDVTG